MIEEKDTNNPIIIDADNVPIIVKDTMTSNDLDKIAAIDRKDGAKNFFKQLLNIIPWAGGAINGEIDVVIGIQEANFFRNYWSYVCELKDTTEEQREKFIEEVEKTAEDYSGNVIVGLISRIDNINKGKILANLTRARIIDAITIEDFFRITNVLERIPFSDLKYLLFFQEENYLEGGVTEILYSSGAIYQSVVGKDSRFRLTEIGVRLLVYGMHQEVTVPAKRNVSVRPELKVIDGSLAIG